MVKKDYIMAILSFLLIPPVALLGGKIFISINPEIAAHTVRRKLIRDTNKANRRQRNSIGDKIYHPDAGRTNPVRF
jgi:hypothetical protein